MYFDGIKTFCLIKHSTCIWYKNEILQSFLRLYFHFVYLTYTCIKVTKYLGFHFSISAMTEFINIRNFTSLFLKDATCYRIIVATFGIDDLNSIWCTEYYAGSKSKLKLFVQHLHNKYDLYFNGLNLLS